MSKVLPSDALWKEGGGYYTEKPADLEMHPILPDTRRLRDRRILGVFRQFGNLSRKSRVLEIGCGKSMWLPCLARQFGCHVAGIDIEPYAAELARANLVGAGVKGEIFCRDAFDLMANRDLKGTFDLVYSMGVMEHFDDVVERLVLVAGYLKPGARILTSVPNLEGVNWLLQRLASLERLHMHVIYDKQRLAAVHERAGFETVAAGYAGFYDGFVSASEPQTAPLQQQLHRSLCWATNMAAEVWSRLFRQRLTPEMKWIAPHVFCVGRRRLV
jgi:2-polyprenyl-6-hydroxyphenyl methylase/3-demethylubiquinone-9 3-methyltransferase